MTATIRNRLIAIFAELRTHAPFTLFGAATGIVCMLLFRTAGPEINHRLFLVFHPAHVVLSAMVTTSLFRLYEKKAGVLRILLIGYIGAVGIATLSDCVLPFFGESMLGVAIPVHSHEHEGAHDDQLGEEHVRADEPDDHEASEAAGSIRRRLHLGFIEDWYIVNPAAILGIAIAYFWPRTRFPHAGHVLVSTWASSFHVLMNTHRELSVVMFIGVFLVLFVAVWLPCCISDIVFPLLFVKSAPLCTHGKRIEEAQG